MPAGLVATHDRHRRLRPVLAVVRNCGHQSECSVTLRKRCEILIPSDDHGRSVTGPPTDNEGSRALPYSAVPVGRMVMEAEPATFESACELADMVDWVRLATDAGAV